MVVSCIVSLAIGVAAGLVGMGFVMVIETSWGDIRARVGLVVADGVVLNHSITL